MFSVSFSKLNNVSNNFLRQLCTKKEQVKKAGVLVIGDEILKGEVIDTNSPMICVQLHSLGVKVQKISIIADEIDEIKNEVIKFSKLYNYVITTGGIGPTHDDVTFEAVAQAFGVPLVQNPHLFKLCCRFYSTNDKNHPGMKLSRIPETAKLNFSDKTNYPNISIKNVYMFPGIPELFSRSFLNISSKLFVSDGVKFFTRYVFINITEDKISNELSAIVNAFPDVQIGSYPELLNKSYKVKITIESINEKSTIEAYDRLIKDLPPEAVVNI